MNCMGPKSWKTSRYQNRKCSKVTSFILVVAVIKFLSDKPLPGHVPDPFPPCGMGSGHTRLLTPTPFQYIP